MKLPSRLLALALTFLIWGCSPNEVDKIKLSGGGGEPINLLAAPEDRISEYLSEELVINDIFLSMRGPGRQDYMALAPSTDELAWLTGFSVEVTADQGVTDTQQYLCHSNLEIADVKQHYMTVANRAFNPGRYFTISQGQSEARLPEGFGIPINTRHALNWNGQALNVNGVPEKPVTTRQKVKLKYQLDRDLAKEMTPLYAMSLVGLVTIGDEPRHYTTEVDGKMSTGGCMLGTSAVKDGVFTDAHGSQFSSHWVVPPGREKNVTSLDNTFTIPEDTTLHYAMLHVHAFCDWVELYDKTADKSVLKFSVEQVPNRIGLLKTQEFSSPEGIKVYKDHAYELRSEYNNTSGVDQDSMVVLYVYLKDKQFKKPQ